MGGKKGEGEEFKDEDKALVSVSFCCWPGICPNQYKAT